MLVNTTEGSIEVAKTLNVSSSSRRLSIVIVTSTHIEVSPEVKVRVVLTSVKSIPAETTEIHSGEKLGLRGLVG